MAEADALQSAMATSASLSQHRVLIVFMLLPSRKTDRRRRRGMNATCNGDTKPFAGQPADVRSADHAVFGLSIEAAANSPWAIRSPVLLIQRHANSTHHARQAIPQTPRLRRTASHRLLGGNHHRRRNIDHPGRHGLASASSLRAPICRGLRLSSCDLYDELAGIE